MDTHFAALQSAISLKLRNHFKQKILLCTNRQLRLICSTKELHEIILNEPTIDQDVLAIRCCMPKSELMTKLSNTFHVATVECGRGLIMPLNCKFEYDEACKRYFVADKLKKALEYGYRIFYLTCFVSDLFGKIYIAAYCDSRFAELTLTDGELDLCVTLLQCSFDAKELLLDLQAGFFERNETIPRMAVYDAAIWNVVADSINLHSSIKPYFLQGSNVMNSELQLICRVAESVATCRDEMLELISSHADHDVVSTAICQLHKKCIKTIECVGIEHDTINQLIY